MTALIEELKLWLDKQVITSNTIGNIRRQCFVPWDSQWNGVVRDETASREVKSNLPNTNTSGSKVSGITHGKSLAELYQKDGGIQIKRRYIDEFKERDKQ